MKSGWTLRQAADALISSQTIEPMIDGRPCPVLEVELPSDLESDWRKRRRYVDLYGVIVGVAICAGRYWIAEGEKICAAGPGVIYAGEEPVISGEPRVYIPKGRI